MDYEKTQRYRLAAAECLEQASRTENETSRLSLLAMAQKWLDLAGASPRDDRQMQS